jgi:3-deoxy-D-manno-octulosonate 8-phosphate phosphatase (KDO 8-P phosphatase)
VAHGAVLTETISPDVLRRAQRVRLILLDVDGVLTDGSIHLLSDGRDGRSFHVRDGLGIKLGQRGGLSFGILSGRRSEAVALRAQELGIAEVHQGVTDKHLRLAEITRRAGVPSEAVCFVGDDVVDLPVFRRVGLAVAPADAGPEALRAAHWVTPSKGGRGAVRETVDLVLKAGGSWDRVLSSYLEE